LTITTIFVFFLFFKFDKDLKPCIVRQKLKTLKLNNN